MLLKAFRLVRLPNEKEIIVDEDEKKIAQKIKEILDLHVPKKAKNQYAIDFTMSEASTILRNGYVLYLKQFLEPNQFVRSKDIACSIFNKIEFQDFSKD